MGIRRYLDVKNWYSDDVILLLMRLAGECGPEVNQDIYDIRRVTEENLADSQSFDAKKFLSVYKMFLEHGDVGVFGYINGRCAARCWGVVNPIDVTEGNKNLGLGRDAIFVHYVETDPSYRRKGLGKAVLGKLISDHQDREMYVTINIDNIPSLKMHKCFGFKEIGIIRIKRRFMRVYTKIYRFDKSQ